MFIAGWSIGVCTPIVTSMAGRIRGTDPTEAIAIVSSGQYLGMIAGPPLFGGLSGLLKGLRWSLLIDAGLILLISFVAVFVDSRLGYTPRKPLASVDELSLEQSGLSLGALHSTSDMEASERTEICHKNGSGVHSMGVNGSTTNDYSSFGYSSVPTEKI
jgi:MFS family permease